MKSRSRRRWGIGDAGIATWAALGAVVFGAGCLQPGAARELTRSHAQSRAAAQERWDEMRGGARLQVAKRHLQARRYKDAERELELVIASTPDQADAYLLSARLWLELGELAKAHQAVESARACSSDAEIDFVAGIVAQRYDDSAAALAHYGRATAKAALVSDYLLAYAEMLIAEDLHLEALELLDTRMRDFDRNAPMRTLAARVLRQLGLRGPALQRAREAVRLTDAKDPGAVADLGSILVWTGRFDEAIELLEPIVAPGTDLERSPDADRRDDTDRVFYTGVLYDLARAYLGAGRHWDAMAAVATLIETRPNDPAPRILLARAALLAGRLDAADDAISAAGQGTGSLLEVHLLDAYVALQRGDVPAAAAAAQRAVDLNGRSPDAYCLVGQAAEAMGDRESARRAYLQATQIDPGSQLGRSLLRNLTTRARRADDNGPASRQADRNLITSNARASGVNGEVETGQ